MKITLRKANAIQQSVKDTLKGITFTTEVQINEFQDPAEVVKQAEEMIAKNMQRRDALYSALYEIRKLVSKGNDVAEISQKLADVALLDKQIVFFSDLASKAVRESDAVINGKLEKIRNDKGESRRSIYGYNDTVAASIFLTDDIDGFKKLVAHAKKQKQRLQDEILEMNVRTEIPLSDTTVNTLTAEGII